MANGNVLQRLFQVRSKDPLTESLNRAGQFPGQALETLMKVRQLQDMNRQRRPVTENFPGFSSISELQGVRTNEIGTVAPLLKLMRQTTPSTLTPNQLRAIQSGDPEQVKETFGGGLPTSLAAQFLIGSRGQIITDALGRKSLVSRTSGKRRSLDKQPIEDTSQEPSTPQNAIPRLMMKAPKLGERFFERLDRLDPLKNTSLRTLIGQANAATEAKSTLLQENVSQAGLGALGFQLARLSGSNSQLSDREREIFENPISFIDSIKNKGMRWFFGNFTEDRKKDLLRYVELLERKARSQTKKLIEEQRKKIRSELGPFYNPGLDEAIPEVDELITSFQDIGQVRDSDIQSPGQDNVP